MARLNFTLTAADTGIGTNARTVLLFKAPTGQRVAVKGFSAFGKGTNNTDVPLKLELIGGASITGGTANSITTVIKDGDVAAGETIQTQCSGNYGTQSTPAEPTYTSPVTYEVYELHPQGGYRMNFDEADEIVIKGGQVFAIRLTASSNETVSVNLFCEE